LAGTGARARGAAAGAGLGAACLAGAATGRAWAAAWGCLGAPVGGGRGWGSDVFLVGMVEHVETLAARPGFSAEDGLVVELFKGNP
jgi:hypothetical protein